MITMPHYLAQSDWLAADRQGQGDTRLTLMPSVIPNSNYIFMVSDWNCLNYFCVYLYCNNQVHRDLLITLYNVTHFTALKYMEVSDKLQNPAALKSLLF
jgi:hypothetical protein